jgi:2-polyprenyl-3-methyl-5-hydroxy-6-metoxy-1,4-benzoquinol methylase
MSLVRRAVAIYSRDGLGTLVRKSGGYVRRSFRETVRNPVVFRLWKLGLLDFDYLYGEQYYEAMLKGDRLNDALAFSRAVAELYDPNRVIDFGAGAGRFLIPFHEEGIEVCGVERSQKALKTSPLPRSVFDLHDLTDPYECENRYDIAFCLEVLEHLPDASVDTTAGSIASSCRVAIVSAATPGQGGTHHVNERTKSEWKRLFEDHGMQYRQDHVDRIRDCVDPQSEKWLVENLLVFVSKASE